MAIILTLLVAAALSVIGLSLVLITETDTKVALATQINKENLNVADGALRLALNVLREKPTTGYLLYPWEKVLPPLAHVRMNTSAFNPTGPNFLENGRLGNGSLSSPSFVDNLGNPAFDDYSSTVTTPTWNGNSYTAYGQCWVLTDLSTPTPGLIQNIPMYPASVTSGSASMYAYYTVYVEAVQGSADWNSSNPANPGTPDGVIDAYDFDRYQVLLRARAVGMYGSVKDVVMVVRLVNPDGTPYGDVPGSTGGGGTGPGGGINVGFVIS